VGPGAIVVIGAEGESVFSTPPQGITEEAALSDPLACVEILGRSVTDRMIERFLRADVELVSVLVQARSYRECPFSGAFQNVEWQVVTDVSSAILQALKDHSQRGIEHSFVISGNVYAETDVLDLFYFHRESRRAATRACNREGLLDLWVVDCEKAQQSGPESVMVRAEGTGAAYFVREYVTRLDHPRDLRRVAGDVLRGCCVARPSGFEVKRGIWVDDGAAIDRRARIVAPAYIGRGATLREDTLITRCSNIEEGCYVDYGTVIEDSSILKHTYTGIWLDVCRAVAEGNKLVSLKRETVLEISDPGVMRSMVRKAATYALGLSRQDEERAGVNTQKEEVLPKPEACGLEANFIQG
jgi:NDP-sugar pyrophosphorylase family protein